jgi:folate-dependent tRNA-U54 methylase TrmFO/GidA
VTRQRRCSPDRIHRAEGYIFESTATGFARWHQPRPHAGRRRPAVPLPTTMLGALYRHSAKPTWRHFQPMNELRIAR